MSSDKNDRIENLNQVTVTNFFSAGDRRRDEMLAQPESSCYTGCDKNCNNMGGTGQVSSTEFGNYSEQG
jgi:hypothetical protein